VNAAVADETVMETTVAATSIRGGGRARTRSRSPYDDRYYRPRGALHAKVVKMKSVQSKDRSGVEVLDDEVDTGVELNEDERDKRTVFVQQLAARLKRRSLFPFSRRLAPSKRRRL